MVYNKQVLLKTWLCHLLQIFLMVHIYSISLPVVLRFRFRVVQWILLDSTLLNLLPTNKTVNDMFRNQE